MQASWRQGVQALGESLFPDWDCEGAESRGETMGIQLGKAEISGMPANICRAVITWERDNVHSEWLWKAELGAVVRIYEDIPSLAQGRFFFLMELS